MYVKNSLLICYLILVVSCDPTISGENERDHKVNITKLGEMHSGYNSDRKMWVDFISCWSKNKNLDQSNIFKSELFPKNNYEQVERRIGVSLPRSYKDLKEIFYLPYSESRLYESALYGFFTLENVKTLKQYDPSLIESYRKYAFESNDAEYFKYGVDQDDASRRFSNLENSIVIGKYTSDSFGYILLYPNSVTSDGEMEAAILFHAGEYRAPSFAELMRQISYLDLHISDHVPPYSQDSIKNTCADKLKLYPIWWR